jgi:molybdate transport system substrate-binding protein
LRILSTNGVRNVLKRREGVTFGTTSDLKAQIERGAEFDIAILSAAAIEDLLGKGLLAPPPREISRTGLGVAIRAGAARPDLSTPEAFKRALLAAKSVVYVKGSVTAGHVQAIFDRLGIQPNARAIAGMIAAEAVARGEADLGLTQISEIEGIAGVEVAGPLPPGLQVTTVFSAAVSSKAGDAARSLLQALP